MVRPIWTAPFVAQVIGQITQEGHYGHKDLLGQYRQQEELLEKSETSISRWHSFSA